MLGVLILRAEAAGCAVKDALELLYEIIDVGKAAGCRDIIDGYLGVDEHDSRVFQPDHGQILLGAVAGQKLKLAGQVAL